VEVGDAIVVGQMLAAPDGFLSAAICSAVSGTVKAIEPRRAADGKKTMAVVVDNDGLFTPLPTLGQERDAASLSAEDLLAIIRDAGIVGQGGAGFPTHVKLTMKSGIQPDTILVNAAECEPYLTCDYRLLLEQPDRLLGGLQVLLQLFPQARAVIGIEDNKREVVRVLKEKASSMTRISVQLLKTKYPQGGERMLIHAVTGRDIHAGKLPIDVGCVVLNVSTVVSIWLAVCRQTPQITTVMSITGDGAAAPCNLAVPVGSSFREVLEAGGGMKGEPEKILSGGPLTGTALIDLDVPVQKTTSAILLMSKDEVARWEPTACIRCGRCVRACPSFIMPVSLSQLADCGDFDAFTRLHGMECIECGCCSYVCPAKRRLTQSMKHGKREVNATREAMAMQFKK
ncbi:MAG: electron transport complex subunit RsxC, partial [Clostridia bacterium]|nr:electron transport complex subunit RsxC [Clostridia bacterium]